MHHCSSARREIFQPIPECSDRSKWEALSLNSRKANSRPGQAFDARAAGGRSRVRLWYASSLTSLGWGQYLTPLRSNLTAWDIGEMGIERSQGTEISL